MRFPYHKLQKIHLTRRALADFDRLHAGVDMPSTIERKSKTMAYDRNFEQLLVDSGYRSDWTGVKIPKPNNWKAIQKMLSENPMLSTEEEHETFLDLLNNARNETKVRTSLLPLFLQNDKIVNEQDLLFTNLEPLVEGISDAKPDLYDGATPTTLNPQIRATLSKTIIPSKNTSAPILPNFFLEFKGPDSTPAVARRQVLHDGSLGARAMKSIKEWNAMLSDENAYTISGTFQDGTLHLYTTHVLSQDNRPVYNTNMVFTRNLRQDPKSLGEGLGAVRNARAWAKAQRDAAISEINSRWNYGSSSATLASSSSDSATLASSSSATLGPLQEQVPCSINNKSQANPKKRGLTTGGQENPPKRQKK